MYLFGTDEYIRHVVAQYSQLLLRVAFTRLKSIADAEDAVQEVFVRLITKKPRLRDEEHEKAWLIRTTINLACDMLRSPSRRNVAIDEQQLTQAEAPPQILADVASMPEKYATVIHLHYYEGYTIKEIARILHLPAATVGTRLARGRAYLKRISEKEEEA